MRLDRVEGGDTKVTFLLRSETATYIRTASAGQGKTQSKFLEDVLERYGRVASLDIDGLRELLISLSTWRSGIKADDVLSEILGIFGVERV